MNLEQKQILKIRQMLDEGIVIAIIHPITFEKIKSNLEKMIVHPNLRFMKHNVVVQGKVVFAKQPPLNVLVDGIFTHLKNKP